MEQEQPGDIDEMLDPSEYPRGHVMKHPTPPVARQDQLPELSDWFSPDDVQLMAVRWMSIGRRLEQIDECEYTLTREGILFHLEIRHPGTNVPNKNYTGDDLGEMLEKAAKDLNLV